MNAGRPPRYRVTCCALPPLGALACFIAGLIVGHLTGGGH